MKFSLIKIAALLTLFLLNSHISYANPSVNNSDTSLTISATVKSKAAPDIVKISAGITTQSTFAREALKENSEQMNAVFKALKKAGIDKKDIQTSGLSIHPQYSYQKGEPGKITQYQASNKVNITIRDIKNTGNILDALVGSGVNNLEGPYFDIENTDAALDIARKEAVKKATARAELYAEATGLKIKRITSISESIRNQRPPMPRPMMMLASGSAPRHEATPVAAGQLDLGITVNIKYELEK